MRTRSFTLLLIAACLCGCAGRTSRIMTGGNCGSLDLMSACPEIKDLAGHIEDVLLIQLSSDSVFLSGVPKMLHYGSKLILFSNELFEFNSDGSFSKTIGRKGRGPGEYVHLNDVALDLENNQLLALTHQNVLLRYSLTTGAAEDETKLDIKASTNGIIPLSKGHFAVFQANPPQDTCAYRLLVFDKNGQLTDRALATDGDFCISMGFRPFVYQSKDKDYSLTFGPSSCYSYVSDGERIAPSAYLDFGSNTLPEDFFKKYTNPWNGVAEAFQEDFFKSAVMLETDGLRYVSAYGKDSSVWNFITDGERGFRWRSIPDTAAPMQALCADEEYLYFLFSEVALDDSEDPLKKYLIEKHSVRLTPEDNPVVVKVKFVL